ncbi:hypothetical protein ACVOMT_20520 (plasmid) [Sphingomonas panni]|uniref:hypothetical protein n=1 Tax=Sphingomonas TaxID=13687 RepID=UPI00115FE89F|nr:MULTISPECIES: hypothetical protein [Sphingomonas]MBX8900699.1 hypothetical protein [Sphingomonas melonis]
MSLYNILYVGMGIERSPIGFDGLPTARREIGDIAMIAFRLLIAGTLRMDPGMRQFGSQARDFGLKLFSRHGIQGRHPFPHRSFCIADLLSPGGFGPQRQ